MLLKALTSWVLHTSRHGDSTAYWATCSSTLLSQRGTFSLYLTVISFPATCDCCRLAIQCLLLRRVCFPLLAFYCKGELLTHVQPVFHEDHQVLFCRAVPPILCWQTVVFCHKCRNLDLPSRNFMKSLLTHSSSLARSLWTEALLACASTAVPSSLCHLQMQWGCNSSSLSRLYNPTLC